MTAAAEAAGIANAVAFEYRYGSAQQALKELIVNGHLAPLRQIEVARFGGEMQADFARPRSSWWYDRAQGGGLANAFMPHIVDMALWLGGRPVRSASGFLRTANPERKAPDGGTYASDVADGCFALADLGDGVAARMTVDGTLSNHAIDDRRSRRRAHRGRDRFAAHQHDALRRRRRRFQ